MGTQSGRERGLSRLEEGYRSSLRWGDAPGQAMPRANLHMSSENGRCINRGSFLFAEGAADIVNPGACFDILESKHLAGGLSFSDPHLTGRVGNTGWRLVVVASGG